MTRGARLVSRCVSSSPTGPPPRRWARSGAGWWFLRKYPCWRLRLHGADTAVVDHVLDELTDAGAIARWWLTVYEPETTAFGGPAGTDAAHDLFCADARGVLDYARHDPASLGRRELSILLLGGLLRAAGLDGFECGDVVDKAARLRPVPADADADGSSSWQGMCASSCRSLTCPTVRCSPPAGRSRTPCPGSPRSRPPPANSATPPHRGRLDCGVRAILTHVLIFHWNRFGLSAASQGILARAATTALLPRS